MIERKDGNDMKVKVQKDGIGTLISELRKQEKISEKELSKGLCSLAEFRKIEAGEKAIGKTLLDALLGRMGRAADNFSIVLEKKQYQLYELRNQIQEAYLTEQEEQLKQGMEKLKGTHLETSRCDYQFYCKMRFLMGAYSYHGLEEMEQILIEIIQITVPKFQIEKVSEYYLCPEEISLCCLMASMYQECGEIRKAKVLLENLLICIEKRYQDPEEKVRIYPQTAILLLRVYNARNENKQWISLCQKTIDLLAENGMLTLMDELLEYYKIGLEEKIAKGQRRFTRLEETMYQTVCQGLKSIRDLKQEYGISYGRREIFVTKHEYYEVFLLQEMILDYRKRAQKSQSQLGEALGVEPETISRYETGRRKPSGKVYRILAEEIGMPKDRYGVVLPIEHYILYEKIRQVERYLFRREFLAAEQLFLELEPLIPKERAENLQYCIRTQAILDYYLHGISEQEKLERLEQAMRLTLPKYSISNENFLECHIPSRYEAILLNNIASSYWKIGEKEAAFFIFEAVLGAYQKSKIGEEYHLASITLIRVSYLMCLGEEGRYREALREIDKTIKMNITFGRGNMMPSLLYDKGWNLLRMAGGDITEAIKNTCMKYYQQAFWISGFMNNFIFQQNLEKLYEKDFDKKLF